MNGHVESNKSLGLIRPINDRIAIIYESIFNYKEYIADEEHKISFGTFEIEYHNYELRQNRQGNKVTLSDYLFDLLDELQNIWNTTINLEMRLQTQFPATFKNIDNTRQAVKYLIQEIELKKLQPSVNNDKMHFSNAYEISSLSKHLFPKAIEQFIQIEKRLLELDFLNEDCVWRGDKTELVALIRILQNRKYFMPVTGKSGSNHFKNYKRFFALRYRSDISEQAKLSKFPLSKLSSYEPRFHFVTKIK